MSIFVIWIEDETVFPVLVVTVTFFFGSLFDAIVGEV